MVSSVMVNMAAAGTLVLAPATVGYKYHVVGFLLGFGAATGTWKFTDDSGDLTGPMRFASTDPPLFFPPSDSPLVYTHENSSLNLVTTGSGARGVVVICMRRA